MKFPLTYIKIFLFFVSVCVLSSCRDELNCNVSSIEDGLDTEVSICISLPNMSVKTRADMSENLLNRVNTLWIGVYNSNTGERTSTQTLTGLNHAMVGHETQKIALKCKSGPSYIVAVANPNSNAYGAAVLAEDGSVTNTALSSALASADTWEKYKRIMIRQLTPGNINMPNPPIEQGLVMTGVFLNSQNVDSHPDNALGEIEPVDIPNIDNIDDPTASVPELKGILHLRRPFAQVSFNIELAGDQLSEFELDDIQIFNLPRYVWAYERVGQSDQQTGAPVGEILDWTNASDAVASDYSGRTKAYANSLMYIPTAMETENVPANGNVVAHTKYTLDLWMFENRRTGLASCVEYADREREYHTEDYVNTGVYTSLSSETPTLNNCATYARIRGTLKYKEGIALNGAPAGTVERSADVEYIVHLGYVNPEKNPRDFNAYRNSKYTYNVTVSGAENIRVEAFQEDGEIAPQPGAQGVMTDVTDESFELDAHYGAFNIQLTEDDLRDCRFSMTAYYGNQVYNFDNSDNATGVNNYPQDENDPNWKFYSWVELRRTTAENVLANYPSSDERNGTNPIYHLADLNKENFQPGWYTVFINENAYEDGDNEGANWHDYVNLPDRKFWIRVTESVSPDGESMYCTAKYAVSQKSIQTYYDEDSETAVGVEHINESFGLNARWTLDTNNLEGDNGRFNVWSHIGGADGGTSAGLWSSYMRMTQVQHINQISNTEQTGPAGVETAARDYPLPSNLIATASGSTYYPQTGNNAQYVEALYACMNRNRDLNGNGTIDANELRWYVPATGNYVRVILGRNSLSTPIMNYSASYLAYSPGGNNTLYHYFTSDNKHMWCEEGLSSGAGIANSWDVRCIRNLGTNLGTVNRNAQIEQAYDDTDIDTRTLGGVVKVSHYYGTALRGIQAEYVPMHKTNSLYNRLGMYGFEVAPRGNRIYTAATIPDNIDAVSEQQLSPVYSTFATYNQAVIDAAPCEDLNRNSGRTGWRVPNQVELVIMRRMNNEKMFNTPSNAQSSFMSCTQEYWGSNRQASSTPGADFRITTVISTLATAQPFARCSYIRCVRDLTEEEEYKSYSDIVNNR